MGLANSRLDLLFHFRRLQSLAILKIKWGLVRRTGGLQQWELHFMCRSLWQRLSRPDATILEDSLCCCTLYFCNPLHSCLLVARPSKLIYDTRGDYTTVVRIHTKLPAIQQQSFALNRLDDCLVCHYVCTRSKLTDLHDSSIGDTNICWRPHHLSERLHHRTSCVRHCTSLCLFLHHQHSGRNDRVHQALAGQAKNVEWGASKHAQRNARGRAHPQRKLGQVIRRQSSLL